MKKLVLSFLCMFSAVFASFSQDTVFILNPVIGDIIDRNEKTDFNLFPEISNTRFEYSYIKKESNELRLIAHLFPDSIVNRQLDTSDIRRMQRDIESLIATRTDTQKIGVQDPGSVVIKKDAVDGSNNNIIDQNTRDRITDESISNQRLQEDAERRKLVKQGSSVDDNGLYIDFSKRRKKK